MFQGTRRAPFLACCHTRGPDVCWTEVLPVVESNGGSFLQSAQFQQPGSDISSFAYSQLNSARKDEEVYRGRPQPRSLPVFSDHKHIYLAKTRPRSKHCGDLKGDLVIIIYFGCLFFKMVKAYGLTLLDKRAIRLRICVF